MPCPPICSGEKSPVSIVTRSGVVASDDDGMGGTRYTGRGTALQARPTEGCPMDLDSYYNGRRVLVTGGLGFLGSNLAIALEAKGAHVVVIDALTEGDGGNRVNLSGFDAVHVVVADIANVAVSRPLVKQAEIIFNLSGKVSHIDSVNDPLADQHANSTSQLVLLEECRRHNPTVRVIY